ncbi:tRNA lysidine(34) synthetase TilS [Litorilituus lipolyticus]|uniref:tRNA(Ile)-lysidine synthase n=1 Tax=Litorilituus lipolyticus TaxID=2491017 RepID=A0A502KQF7_9GAMM|nr:tRNA lysidine(34) synthetase TilS [Litorilituus lipolyticus]TPH13868.1 tRNA lysidine(34) synthetase TilS [Litorilituus lipolyticus]
MDINSSLKAFFHSKPNHPIVIAYSGGVDSQVLLHALSSLKQQNIFANNIIVCHVNHGLSDNALYWQSFAETQCQQLNVELKVCAVNVKEKAQHSLEALARDARYQALIQVNQQQSYIVTGHHSDDQVETFLLALKRGSGLKGLSAMAEQTKLQQHILVRPLLQFTREQIIAYAKEHKLDWVEDESNQDTSFDRNFLRQDIIPQLTQRWSSFNQTVNRSAAHCAEGQLLLDELAEQDLIASRKSDLSLRLAALRNLSIARFNNLIRYFLSTHHTLMPTSQQLGQLRQQISADDDKTPQVKLGDKYLRRYKGALYLTPEFNDISSWSVLLNLKPLVNSHVELSLPDGLGSLYFIGQYIDKQSDDQKREEQTVVLTGKMQQVKAPKDGQKVTIKFSHNNPKCLPDYRQHSRALKKVLQELNLPPWQRQRTPFLFYDEQLVAVIGHFVCQEFMASQSEQSVTVCWQQD